MEALQTLVEGCETVLESGGLYYATNSVFLLCTKTVLEVKEGMVTLEDIKKALQGLPSTREWKNFSDNELKLNTKLCAKCDGQCKVKRTKCMDCEGEGSIVFTSKSGVVYPVECEFCDTTGYKIVGSEGELIDCWYCDGKGEVEVLNFIEIGNKFLNENWLYRLNKLNKFEISMDIVDNPLNPVPFRFEGGIGVLMPCRKGHKL